jgi:hypothetical protein
MRSSKEKLQMALLTGYFDESGLHEEDVCVVAGFVGNDAQWSAFAADWIPAIKPGKNLHMRKLRWNSHPVAVPKRLARLGPIPHKFNLSPVMAGMKWKDYNSIVKPKNKNKFSHPYVFCALCAIEVVLHEIAEDDEVLFLFDRQEGLRRETMEELRAIVFDWLGADKRVKGIDFMCYEDTVCLDPADYLAYIIRERSLDMNSFKSRAGESIIGAGGNGGWIPEPYLNLLASAKSRPTRDLIEDMMKNPYFRGLIHPER